VPVTHKNGKFYSNKCSSQSQKEQHKAMNKIVFVLNTVAVMYTKSQNIVVAKKIKLKNKTSI